MRKLALILLGVASCFSVAAAKPVNVEQLQQLLDSLHGKSDAEIMWQISELQLTERLSTSRFERLKESLPGEKSRQALVAIADQSAFLDPPVSEIPTTPTPPVAEQRRMMSLVAGYVTRAIPQLPNFLATRTTNRFEDTPHIVRPYQPTHFVDTSQTTVLYRERREVEESGSNAPHASNRGLSSQGEFGYILSTILLDASQNKLAWMRWEHPSSTTLAVFAFSVPREKSHFELNYCCVADSEGHARNWHEFVGYSGHMAIDPQTGEITQIVINADFKPGQPISTARLAVEYSPVEIGGRTYTCPVHSIAFSRAQGLSRQIEEIIPGAAHGQAGGNPSASVVVGTTSDRAEQSLLNDVIFSNYHVFRSEAHVLTSEEARLLAVPPANDSEDGSSTTQGSAAAPIPPNPADHAEAESNPLPSAVASTAPGSTSAVAPPVPTVPTAPVPEAPAPEISVTSAASLPDAPAVPQPPVPHEAFALRMTSRLVDVDLVAFDKKGRPVTDLKPDNLEIYDDGRKQTIRFFTQAGPVASAMGPAHAEPNSPVEEPVLSNRQEQASNAMSGTGQKETNVTILMIDASHLAFGDFTYARSEMLRFLKIVPLDEPVGLYALKSYGFQILLEPSTDRAQLAATLAKWMPTAQDMARAQEEEQRNRQQVDFVHGLSEMTQLNGNANTVPETLTSGDTFAAISHPSDPSVVSMGSNPGRDALTLLLGVSRHLAAIPGHKTLVWVTSDNVLADWTTQAAPKQEQGKQFIYSFALQLQETLNESHVSIYPLDASQLEAGGIGANLRERNAVPVGMTSRSPALAALGDADPGLKPGRITAQMQQDLHPIAGIYRDLAKATGGRALRRAGDIAAELNSIVEDGRAVYLLSFAPDMPPDDEYHSLIVKVVGRHDIALRYRTGYEYSKEPVALKDHFRQAIWQPTDLTQIAMSASPKRDSHGSLLRLNIAGTDLGLAQQGDRWTDKLDIFLVERDDAGLHAKVRGQTVGLRLLPATYQRILKEGLAFDQRVESKSTDRELRVVVVDENSGHIGSLTVPASVLQRKE